MKKILQIPNYQYPNIGGIEQVARDLANALKDNEDISQKMICFNTDAQDGDYICKQKETVHDYVDGIEVIRCGCIAKVASQSISLTYPMQLFQVLKNYKPDVVIFHFPNPFVASFLLPLLSKKTKFVLYWHLDITKQKLLKKVFHLQTESLLKRADVVVATSPNYVLGSPYLKRYHDKCVVIPNCISDEKCIVTPEIQKRAEEIRQQYQGKTLCFGLGRHIPYKGFTYLVQASQYLDDSFVIAIGGSGELTESLKEEAKVDSKIYFLGRISNIDVVAYCMACDIFCFPSITKNEAFGIALAEGMYHGKPAVTFTIPGSGVNYVNLDNVTGLEVPNRDVKAYAEAMQRLAADEQLRRQLGQNAKQRVEENFLSTHFVLNIQQLYRDIVNDIKTENSVEKFQVQ